MKLRRRKIFITILCICLLIFGGVLIAFPDRYLHACFEGICLWGECVLPSLFPFMVITSLLIKLGAPQAASKPFKKLSAKLNLPESAFPLFLMSVFSGYPAGSRILCEYKDCGLIDDTDIKKLAPLCSACGPLFALGTVGARAFGGGTAGIKLWCACLISVVATSLIYCIFGKRKPVTAKKLRKTDRGNLLQSCFFGAVSASLTAGAFICFFYTLSKVLADFNIFKPVELLFLPLFGSEISAGLASGLCEATGGCFALANAGGFFALPLAGFTVTFGGASILLQQLSYLSQCGVKAGFFIGFKFLQGIICFAILCIFALF
ncbi:MAG: hypothetical protein K2N14_01770 [Clostridia bacterium]|nr:hypothetical protein [Clostridia bacterium]